MYVHIIKIFSDISNNYQGINDIEVYAFSTHKQAAEMLDKLLKEKIRYFEEEYEMNIEDLYYELTDISFHINNDKDYFSAEIVKKAVL